MLLLSNLLSHLISIKFIKSVNNPIQIKCKSIDINVNPIYINYIKGQMSQANIQNTQEQIQANPQQQQLDNAANIQNNSSQHQGERSLRQRDAMRQTMKLSIFFFLLFTSFSSYMVILTHIYEEQGLTNIGPTALAFNYILFITSTILAPLCPWKLKTQLVYGAVLYTVNYSSGIFIAMIDSVAGKYVIGCAGAAIAGSSGGLLWVSQGRYLQRICEINLIPQNKKGIYFGRFSLIYCLTNVSAGLITTFALGFFDPKIYFAILTIIGILAVIFALFLKDISNDTCDNTRDNTNKISNKNRQSQEDIGVANNNGYHIKLQQIKQGLKQVFKYYPKMMAVLPILIIDGIALGIYSSQITHLIPLDTPKEDRNLYAGFATISLGVGATIGGFMSGWLGDKLKPINSGRITVALFIFGCIFNIITVYMQLYALTLIAAFIWGLMLFYLEGWMYLMCSRIYAGKSEAFSVNKQVHSILYFLFQIMVISTQNKLNLYILMGSITVLAIPAVMMLQRLETYQKQERLLSNE